MCEEFKHFTELAELGARLDAVRTVTGRLLKNDPNNSAAELVTAVQEVTKTFIGFEALLIRFLSLSFVEGARERDRAELVVLEGGGSRELAGEMRARCSKIGAIYRRSLAPWFNFAPLSNEERSDLAELFEELAGSDSGVIIPAVHELAGWLEKNIDAVTPLVNAGEYEVAAERVVLARQQIAPVRRTMDRLRGEFRDLEIQFTA